MSNRIIVGISGASCSGKTTLVKLLRATFPWASAVHQDAYYYPNESKYHVYLPDVKHFNYDLKSAINFPKLESDLQKILSSQQKSPLSSGEGEPLLRETVTNNEKLLFCPNENFVRRHKPTENETSFLVNRFSRIPLTLLEGHILFSHPAIYNLCNLKYFLTLDQVELFARRRQRVYDPPNPPGYLEKYVWPAYLSRVEEIKSLPGIHYYDAKEVPLLDMYQELKRAIALQMAKMIKPEPPVEYSSDTKVKIDQKG